jgi:hypothetical protein
MIIGQLARTMELAVQKQVILITGNEPSSSGVLPVDGSRKMEFWIGTNETGFHITIEEKE